MTREDKSEEENIISETAAAQYVVLCSLLDRLFSCS